MCAARSAVCCPEVNNGDDISYQAVSMARQIANTCEAAMGDRPASLALTVNSRAQTFGSKRRSQFTDPANTVCHVDAMLPCAGIETTRYVAGARVYAPQQ
jgi:hypothetical protein